MEKKLLIKTPIVSFVPQNNFIFSILSEEHPFFYEYIFSNYIQISFEYKYYWSALRTRFFDEYLYNYMKNECLMFVSIPRDTFTLFSGEKILPSIIRLIDLDYYISVNVDIFYIKAYGVKDHISHELMIYGYNNDSKQLFAQDFVNGEYRSFICTYLELQQAIENYVLTKENFVYDGLIALKPCKNHTPKINLAGFVNQLQMLLTNEFDLSDTSFGLSWFNAVIYLLHNDSEHFFISSLSMSLHFLQQHIVLMEKRIMYLCELKIIKSTFLTEIGQIKNAVLIAKQKSLKIHFKSNFEKKLRLNSSERIFFVDELKRISVEYNRIISKLVKNISMYISSHNATLEHWGII